MRRDEDADAEIDEMRMVGVVAMTASGGHRDGTSKPCGVESKSTF